MTRAYGTIVFSFILAEAWMLCKVCEGDFDDREPPRFLQTKQNVTVYKGSTAVLRCIVDFLGPKTVSWRRAEDNYVLSIDKMMYARRKEMSIDHVEISEFRSSWNLVIKRAQPRHSGLYECQISAKYPLSYGVFLKVYDTFETIQPTVELGGTIYVSRYQDIKLTCNATGSVRAPVDIDWFYEGTKINTKNKRWKGRTVITKYQPEIPGRTLVSNLIISKSKYKDRGTYICRSSDLATKSVEVFVLNADRDVIKREEEYLPKVDFSNAASLHSSVYTTKMFLLIVIITMIRSWCRS